MNTGIKARTLALLLAGLMAVTMSSCAGRNSTASNTSGTGSNETQAPTTATEAAKDVDDGSEAYEYTWVGYAYQPVTAEGENAKIQRMIEKKYNIKLKQVFVDRSNYSELMNLKFASNEIPDVFTADNAVMLGQWVNQGVLAEIKQSDIKTYAPDIYAELNGFKSIDPNVMKYAIIGNKNYALQMVNLDCMYRAPVIWRTDWLEKVGITKLPETLDEYKVALYKIAQNDPDGNNKKDTYGMSATGLDAIYGASGFIPTSWGKKDGKVVWGGIQPEIKEILRQFQQWYKDGVIDPEFVTGENQGGYWATSQPFINGKIGMTTLGNYYHWNPPYFDDQDWTSNNGKQFREIQGKDAKYDFGKPAISADGKTGMYLWPIASSMTVCGIQMEKEPKKLQRFLKSQNGFAADKDYYINVRYGIQGENWEYDSHNMIKVLDDAKTPKDKSVTGMGGGFSFMNYNCMKWYKEIYKQQYEFAGKVCSDALYLDACYGSLPSQSRYKTELDKLQNTTYIGIITGSLPIDEFDSFAEKWMKQGGEQLTKEANDWVANIEGLSAE